MEEGCPRLKHVNIVGRKRLPPVAAQFKVLSYLGWGEKTDFPCVSYPFETI